MQVPAPHIHSGVHHDLPHQLLFSLDSVLTQGGTDEGVHIAQRAPLGVAAASLEESQEANEVLVGGGLCRSLSSDGMPDDQSEQAAQDYDYQPTGNSNSESMPDATPAVPDGQESGEEETSHKKPEEASTEPPKQPVDEPDDSAPTSSSDSSPQEASEAQAGQQSPDDEDDGTAADDNDSNRTELEPIPIDWDVEILLPGRLSCYEHTVHSHVAAQVV